MKRLVENHSLRWIVIGWVLAIVLWFVLRALVLHSNHRIELTDLPDRPYGESVRVAPGTPLFFTWGVTASPRTKAIGEQNLPEEERFGDTYTQAHSVLRTLTNDLKEVGLTLRDVVNVRAYLVGDAANPPDFAGWNRAFMEYFGTAHTPHKPARTSVGITRLFLPAYRIEVEFIAAFPDGRGPFVVGSKPYRVADRLKRVETSEAWRSYGRPRFPMSTGKALRGGDPLFFSSAVLPKPMNPMMAPQYWMFGPIAGQAQTIFQQVTPVLSKAGIDYRNLFFVRTIMFPEGDKPIGPNFGTFNKEYGKFLNNATNPNRPTRTVMSAPGFTYRKQLMAVEMYGLYDDTANPMDFSEGLIKRIDISPASGSDGVFVSGNAGLEFFSGMISPQAADSVTAEAEAILALLDEKLAARKLDRSNLVSMRVYLDGGADIAKAVESWEAVYKANFGTEAVEHEPALTVMPIVSLPGERLVEIEILAAYDPANVQN